jgi:hypothetical protein
MSDRWRRIRLVLSRRHSATRAVLPLTRGPCNCCLAGTSGLRVSGITARAQFPPLLAHSTQPPADAAPTLSRDGSSVSKPQWWRGAFPVPTHDGQYIHTPPGRVAVRLAEARSATTRASHSHRALTPKA